MAKKLLREFWWFLCTWHWGQWLYWHVGYRTVRDREARHG